MFCALSVISLSWKTLVFGRFTSQERTNVHRTAFFLHTPDFSLSKVTALKVVWGKDTSRRSKGPGSDLPSCFPAWVPFCKCGWLHHISRSGCGPGCSTVTIAFKLADVKLESSEAHFLRLGENLSWDFEVIYIFRYLKGFYMYKKTNDIFFKFRYCLLRMPKIIEIGWIFHSEKHKSKT